MENKRIIEIAKEEKERFTALKKTCDSCIPDELLEWIDAVILKFENEEKIKNDLEVLYRKEGLPCEHDTFNANHCMGCKFGQESQCQVYLAYREILELL